MRPSVVQKVSGFPELRAFAWQLATGGVLFFSEGLRRGVLGVWYRKRLRRVRDDYFPKSLVDPDAIKGVDGLMKEAVNLKFISEPLTQKQLDELIQIPPRKK